MQLAANIATEIFRAALDVKDWTWTPTGCRGHINHEGKVYSIYVPSDPAPLSAIEYVTEDGDITFFDDVYADARQDFLLRRRVARLS